MDAALDRDRLVDAVAAAMEELSNGRASVPPRTGASVADVGGMLLAMPAYVPSAGALAAKLVGQFPRNPARGLPSHVAVIAVFDPETGVPLAVMDGEVITAERTAAASALSARLLARADARGAGRARHGRAGARARTRPRARASRCGAARRRPRPRQGRGARRAELGAELGVPARPAAGYREAIAGRGHRVRVHALAGARRPRRRGWSRGCT